MAKNTKNKSKFDDIDEATLQQIRASLGLSKTDEALMLAGDFESVSDVISTGHPNLDEVLTPVYFEKNGVGGVPRGYVCEFFGPNAGGKSSLCLKLAAAANSKGDNVLWVDAEGSFQSEFAEAHGINPKKTILCSKPGSSAENYLKLATEAAKGGQFSLVVIDSLAGLVPAKIMAAELEKDAKIGEMARLMSRACPLLVSAAKEGDCAIVFINQIRMKVGVMYGNPETTPGGESLRFYASLRLRVDKAPSKMRTIVKDDEEIGMRSKVFITKSRFGAPYKETIVPIYYGMEKPCALDLLIDQAISNKVMTARTTKKDGITRVTMKSDFKNLPLDELRSSMTPDLVRTIADRLSEVIVLDPDVQKYVDTVDEHLGDPTEEE